MGRTPQNIADVVGYQLCSGCGACAYAHPDDFEMIDTLDFGRVPRSKPNSDPRRTREGAGLEVCPGVGLSHDRDQLAEGIAADLVSAWGPVIGLWEGHAKDPELRFAASSGGVASALALHAIEKRGHHGLCHIAARPDAPYLNHTVLSRSREEILAATGSRYAPASPCEGLDRVEGAPSPCVFIGKPCDVAATGKARRLRPELDEKLGLTVAIFCAGTPSLRGTLDLMRSLGASSPQQVESLRYRGRGWPGNAAIVFDAGEGKQSAEMSYGESWGNILQELRLWRCKLCADHSGEFADIAVGDPWYREVPEEDVGSSLIVIRTARGMKALEAAISDGYVEAKPVENSLLPASQGYFLFGRGAIWGRILTLRAMGLPAPRYLGMPMFRYWWSELRLGDKFRSIIGTIRRARSRGLARRLEPCQYEPKDHE